MMPFRWIAGLLLAILALLPSDGLRLSACLFNETFGLACPACGLTRSLSSLLHFEFIKSVNYHPLGFLVMGILLYSLLSTQSHHWLKQRAFKNKIDTVYSLKLIVSVFLLVWIIRII
ncbi:DUF2752 domain-containing protein [bacterium]|nr:DUF2752 domain-containing protein [bacterium]